MTAEQYLAQFGVSMQLARDFVFAHLADPATILAVSDQYGITNDMLGEIVGSGLGIPVSGDTVIGWFAGQGLDSTILDPLPEGTAQGLTPDLLELAGLVTLNQNTGALSTESLQAGVMAQLPLANQADYGQMFDPSRFQGSADGVFTGEELGVPGLADLPATSATLQALFFGTLISAMLAVDPIEFQALNGFINANFTALENGDLSVREQYHDLMIDIFKDPSAQFFTTLQMAQFAVVAGVNAVLLIGTGQAPNLFDSLDAYPCFM